MRAPFAAGFGAVLALALGVPAGASAQSHGPIAHEIYREGFLIGFSIGAGAVGPNPCHDCGLAPGAELHLGGMASREFAFMVEAGGLGNSGADHAYLVASGQWWPDPAGRFWAKGGVGVGSGGEDDSFDSLHHGNDNVYGTLMAGGGVEVVRSGRFTIDMQARGIATKEPDRWRRSGIISVGFNWY